MTPTLKNSTLIEENNTMISFPLQTIIDAKIIEPKGELILLGNNWFRDRATGICYHVEKTPEKGELVVTATRQSKIDQKPKRRFPRKEITKTTIKCVDCGTEREIKVQDKFQVTRCKQCQRQRRLTIRKQSYFNKMKELANGTIPKN